MKENVYSVKAVNRESFTAIRRNARPYYALILPCYSNTLKYYHFAGIKVKRFLSVFKISDIFFKNKNGPKTVRLILAGNRLFAAAEAAE